MKLISGNRITKLLNNYSCKFCMKNQNHVHMTGLQWSIFWFDIFWHSESSLTAHICVVFVYKSRRKISKKASLRKNVFIFFISRKPNFVFWAVQIEIFTEKLHEPFRQPNRIKMTLSASNASKTNPLDTKREEFRKYLEKEGILEQLTRSLVRGKTFSLVIHDFINSCFLSLDSIVRRAGQT